MKESSFILQSSHQTLFIFNR